MKKIMSYMVATILAFVIATSIGMNNGLVAVEGTTQSEQGEGSGAQAQDQMTITNPTCGQVVEGLVQLTANLVCPDSDGLIVGDDEVVIDLNGFTIQGPGANSSKVGIVAPNTDLVRITDGTISDFQAAFIATGADQVTVDGVKLVDNKIGAFLTGTDGIALQNNVISGNTIGVASHSSSESTITANLLTENSLSGITFVNTDGATVDLNNIVGSQTGIFLDAQSEQNTVSNNNVMKNVLDINNGNGLPANVNNNVFENNNCVLSNPSGLCIGR